MKIIEQIPSWAINAIINGDLTGLSEDDIDMIHRWFEDTGYDIIRLADEQQYFTWHPAFGLPCDVYDCYCINL